MDWHCIFETVKSLLPSWEAAAAIAGALSALAAFWTIQSTAKTRKNERLSAHAITTLERAYGALSGGDHAAKLPLQDRLAWLTTARLIEEYKDAKTLISDPIFIRENESHEEHWRRQFYVLLEPLQLGHLGFYRDNEIEKTSAVIVHNFAEWPENKVDPIAKYGSYKKAADALHISKMWFSVRAYLGLD